MRIAVVSWSRRKVGGLESYLGQAIPGLLRAGHAVGFWHETDEPADRGEIELPAGVEAWSAADLGALDALRVLRDWRPEVIYAHGLLDPELEAGTLAVAPAVFLAHGYYGTCISGGKTFKSPVVTPCNRRFGWQCLLHYYPHRCGGWSPVTMFREYRRQSRRLELLRRYGAIVTLSEHMRSEYLRHGFTPDCVYNLSSYVSRLRSGSGVAVEVRPADAAGRSSTNLSAPDTSSIQRENTWRLLFLGRMDLLKGGRVFLEALPRVRMSLGQPLRVTLAGDGPDRQVWERKAAQLQARDEGLVIEFVGWVADSQLSSLLGGCDLLVLPSLWPEPFGLVGLEAGLHGVPTAAFAVGGIPEWLIDGVNGYLAPGNPPTTAGLAQAIVDCLRDRAAGRHFRLGAMEMARRFDIDHHVAALQEVFARVSDSR